MTSTELANTPQPVYEGPRFPTRPDLGPQRIYLLPNGYGVSLIRGPGSYAGADTWELAVIRVKSTMLSIPDSDETWDRVGVEHHTLCYHTSVGGDVVGWQTEDEVRQHLATLAVLPDDHECNGKFPHELDDEPDFIDGEVIGVIVIQEVTA